MSTQITQNPTPEEDYLRDNIVNSIDLLATQYFVEVKKLIMLNKIFVEAALVHKSLENSESKSDIETHLKTLFSDIQKTNKNVFITSSIFFLITHSYKSADVEEVKEVNAGGGKMSGGNVGHFFIILMWILYGTYFLSTGTLKQTSILSHDGDNQQVSLPENVVGKELYTQFGAFMENFATAYNKQIESNSPGSLKGILPITLNNTTESLTINMPKTFDTEYGNILKVIEDETANQKIIDDYIPTGADVVSVMEDAVLMGFVNIAADKIFTSKFEDITLLANKAASLANGVANVAANVAPSVVKVVTTYPATATITSSMAITPIVTTFGSMYNSIIQMVESLENGIQKNYDALILLITSNLKENIKRLEQLKTQIDNHNNFIKAVKSKTSNLRGTLINDVQDLVADKPLPNKAVVAKTSYQITDDQINGFISGIKTKVLLFASNVTYETTYVSGSIIMNFLKNILADIRQNKIESSIGLTALLIPLIIFSGFLKMKPKNPSQVIENKPPAIENGSTTGSKGGRKTKKPKHIKKNKKTQKKSKYIRKLRKNSVII